MSLTETDLPNGVVTANAYDGEGRMTETSSVNASSTVLQAFDYAYDAAGNRTSQTDRNNDTTTYSYDGLNRLTEWDPPTGPAVSYGYDAAGNRTSADGVTSAFNELNQLTGSSDGTSYDYDDAGRLIERDDGSQVTSYEWDALDQLTEVDDGTDPISYTYDALGRRAERGQGSVAETAHYGDLTDRAILDSDGASSVIRSYVQGGGGLVEQRAGSTTSFPLTDAHGDVTTLSDGSGGLASRQEFGPWGDQLSGPTLQMGWLGGFQRRADPAAEILQMGARPYVPNNGRFLSEDPLLGVAGVGQSHARYSYAWDNPVNLYDLDGRSILGIDGNICIPAPGPIPVEGCAGTDGIQGCVGGQCIDQDDVWDTTALPRGWANDRLADFFKAVRGGWGSLPDEVQDFLIGCASGAGAAAATVGGAGGVWVPGYGWVGTGLAALGGCVIGGGGNAELGVNPIRRN